MHALVVDPPKAAHDLVERGREAFAAAAAPENIKVLLRPAPP